MYFVFFKLTYSLLPTFAISNCLFPLQVENKPHEVANTCVYSELVVARNNWTGIWFNRQRIFVVKGYK